MPTAAGAVLLIATILVAVLISQPPPEASSPAASSATPASLAVEQPVVSEEPKRVEDWARQIDKYWDARDKAFRDAMTAARSRTEGQSPRDAAKAIGEELQRQADIAQKELSELRYVRASGDVTADNGRDPDRVAHYRATVLVAEIRQRILDNEKHLLAIMESSLAERREEIRKLKEREKRAMEQEKALQARFGRLSEHLKEEIARIAEKLADGGQLTRRERDILVETGFFAESVKEYDAKHSRTPTAGFAEPTDDSGKPKDDPAANELLKEAQRLLRTRFRNKARVKFTEIVEKYPDTSAANEAQRALFAMPEQPE